ncbi:ATP-binding protein [Acetoanaerobium noterae]|uniref:ATP-binding protein n=1 Tax=Acetoanaerobium noterae TaxID=745369 RepID=UPI0028AE5C9F|nr:ATP-binding protein [Acetoanaerobium noterae]
MNITDLIGESTEYDKKQALEVRKPKSWCKSVSAFADGSLTAFYRVGNQSVPATPSKLIELVLKGSATSYDSLKSKYSFNNMSFTKLKSTYHQKTGNQFDESDFESFGIIDSEKNLTNAGALLADESPIKHSRLFCTRWNGLDKAPGIVDALDDKEYSGGLINLLQDGTDFVINNSKKIWRKTSDGRVEMPDYPERAVLEGIVNALIHRNYLEVGSEVHIDMFDDRVEIYSPGGMYDGTKVQERDLLHVPSRRRNPIIADIFNRLKFMDRRGSGFKKILGDYRMHPLYNSSKDPMFNSDNDSFLLVLKNMNYDSSSYKKSGDKKSGDKKAAIKTTTKTLSQYEKILNYMEKDKEYGIQEFCELLQLKESRTREILKGLLDYENKIEAVGLKKNRKYRLL